MANVELNPIDYGDIQYTIKKIDADFKIRFKNKEDIPMTCIDCPFSVGYYTIKICLLTGEGYEYTNFNYERRHLPKYCPIKR